MDTVSNRPIGECRHGRPECECQDNTSQSLSSGRWDAVGSWEDATYFEREKARIWAKNLGLKYLHWAITVMAEDTNAFTLYERKALLEVAAIEIFDKWVKEMNDH